MRIIIKLFVLFFLMSPLSSYGQTLPYKDRNLPIDQRVEDLIGRMTLDEKIAQIGHVHSWDVMNGQDLDHEKFANFCSDVSWGFAEGFPLTAASTEIVFRQMQTYMVEKTRLGIPAFIVTESLHGALHEGATIFPQNIALGSTFNPRLAYQKTKMISKELHKIGANQVLSPNIDVARELRWGRIEETFGEDPFLTSEMAVAEVKGYLDNKISPMLKHYGPHGNPLSGLNLASVECGVRDLFDIYLKPFEKVIKETDVMAVMSSYNAWNREPNSSSKFMLTDILRKSYGFKGYVYADWGSIGMLKDYHKTAETYADAAKQALTAGLDVEASSRCYTYLKPLIENGEFDVEYVNEAVRRVLTAKMRMGLFEHPYGDAEYAKQIVLQSNESEQVSKQIADESIVLLKNENSLLPLRLSNLKSIAVIGPNANEVQFGDYTWSKDNIWGITPLQGIKQIVGNHTQISYAEGCSMTSLDTSKIRDAVEAAQKSDVALIFVGSSSTAFIRHHEKPSTSGEGMDLHDISLTGAQEELIKAVYETGTPVVVVLVTGKVFAIPWVKENIPAILVQWYGGEKAGNSIAEVLFGDVNPSGKLTFTFPQSTGHLPVYYNHFPIDRGFYKSPGTYDNPGRDYVFSDPKPLWAFGHGLSYSDFSYESATTDKETYNPYDTIVVTSSIKNRSKLSGKEVVQVYVRDVVSSVVTPVQQLKGFEKLLIEPNEIKKSIIKIPVKELYLTDNMGNRYLEEGSFEIQVGRASDDIKFNIPIYVGNKKNLTKTKIVQNDGKADKGKRIVVKGVVRDVQSTPIANVKLSSQGNISYTDKKGEYTLNTSDVSEIVVEKQGFEKEIVPVNKQTTINIQIKYAAN